MEATNGISISPARAADMSAQNLIDFVQKLFDAGMPFIDIQRIALAENSHERLMMVERMVKGYIGGNPFELLTNQSKQWEALYDHYFGNMGGSFNKVGLNNLLIPSIPIDGQLLLVGKDIHIGQVIYTCKQSFNVNMEGYDVGDLMSQLCLEERSAKEPYSVIVKKIVNASEDRKYGGKSIDDLKMDFPNYSGITLLERVLYELLHFSLTGNHLDTEDYSDTICTGSYFTGRGFPTVRYSTKMNELQISCLPGDTYIPGNNDYAREVIG